MPKRQLNVHETSSYNRVSLMAERYERGEDIWTGEITPESEAEFFRNVDDSGLTNDETSDTLVTEAA